MQKILNGTIILLIIAIGGLLFFWKPKAKEIHIHAGFHVYLDGKLQDFSKPQFMTLGACGESNRPIDEQLEKAHLHDGIGDVVHVHREGALWGDLLKNIRFAWNASKPVAGYINGTKVDNILSQSIKPYDSVIILIGTNDYKANMAQNAVKKDRIIEAEQRSESCGMDHK